MILNQYDKNNDLYANFSISVYLDLFSFLYFTSDLVFG